jgi:hypothetical protein
MPSGADAISASNSPKLCSCSAFSESKTRRTPTVDLHRWPPGPNRPDGVEQVFAVELPQATDHRFARRADIRVAAAWRPHDLGSTRPMKQAFNTPAPQATAEFAAFTIASVSPWVLSPITRSSHLSPMFCRILRHPALAGRSQGDVEGLRTSSTSLIPLKLVRGVRSFSGF